MSVALAKQQLSLVAFDSPVLSNIEDQKELMEAMQANFADGVPIDFPRIKIPSGGGLTFEIPGEDEPETTKELVGVIVDNYRVNAYWAEEFSGAGAPPDCSALDGKTGEGKPGGSCDACQFNDWGSSVKGGRGKACKNLRRVYLLVEGEMLPYMLALPPTSLDDFNTYMRRLTSKHKVPFYGAISKAKLYKSQNKDGIVFSAVAWSFVGALSVQDKNNIKNYAANLKSAMRTATIEFTDYVVEPNGSGAVDAGAVHSDDGEPF